MRLFVGLALPQEVQEDLARQVKKAQPIESIRWIMRDCYHITLKFLGEVSFEKIPPIQSNLSAIASHHRELTLSCCQGGVFPSANQPRVFWTRINGDQEGLKQLAIDVESKLAEVGYPPENRAYRPHLTLGKSKQAGSKAALQFCALFEGYQSPPFKVRSLDLFQSHLALSGSRYEVYTSYPLEVPWIA